MDTILDLQGRLNVLKAENKRLIDKKRFELNALVSPYNFDFSRKKRDISFYEWIAANSVVKYDNVCRVRDVIDMHYRDDVDYLGIQYKVHQDIGYYVFKLLDELPVYHDGIIQIGLFINFRDPMYS